MKNMKMLSEAEDLTTMSLSASGKTKMKPGAIRSFKSLERNEYDHKLML